MTFRLLVLSYLLILSLVSCQEENDDDDPLNAVDDSHNGVFQVVNSSLNKENCTQTGATGLQLKDNYFSMQAYSFSNTISLNHSSCSSPTDCELSIEWQFSQKKDKTWHGTPITFNSQSTCGFFHIISFFENELIVLERRFYETSDQFELSSSEENGSCLDQLYALIASGEQTDQVSCNNYVRVTGRKL